MRKLLHSILETPTHSILCLAPFLLLYITIVETKLGINSLKYVPKYITIVASISFFKPLYSID